MIFIIPDPKGRERFINMVNQNYTGRLTAKAGQENTVTIDGSWSIENPPPTKELYRWLQSNHIPGY